MCVAFKKQTNIKAGVEERQRISTERLKSLKHQGRWPRQQVVGVVGIYDNESRHMGERSGHFSCFPTPNSTCVEHF